MVVSKFGILTAAATLAVLSGCGNSVPESSDLAKHLEQSVPEKCRDFVKFHDINKTNGYADGDNYRVEYSGKVTITPPKDWAESQSKKLKSYEEYSAEFDKSEKPKIDAFNDAVNKYNEAVNDFNFSNRMARIDQNNTQNQTDLKTKQEALSSAESNLKGITDTAYKNYLKIIKINEKYANTLGLNAPKPSNIEKHDDQPLTSSQLYELERAAQKFQASQVISEPPQSYVSCIVNARYLSNHDLTSRNSNENREFAILKGTVGEWNGKMLMRKTEQGWAPVD